VATLTGISPVLLAADLDRSAAYYRDRLGFECLTYDAPHGFREFGVQDPDGHDIAFGRRTAQP
jgi:hypothetical protein